MSSNTTTKPSTYQERNAWRAYHTVMFQRLDDLAKEREAFVQMSIAQVERVHVASRCPVPLEEHKQVILAQAFEWDKTRGPS